VNDLALCVDRQWLLIPLKELVEGVPVLGTAGLAVEAAVVPAAAAEVVVPAIDRLRDDVVQNLEDVEERVVVPADGMLCVRPDVFPADARKNQAGTSDPTRPATSPSSTQ